MLTPKHRALFAAAYSTRLLQSSTEAGEPAPVPAGSGEGHDTQKDEQDRRRPTRDLPAA